MGASSDPLREFENYISKINTEVLDAKIHNGYLINLDKFNEFKRDFERVQNKSLFACAGSNELILVPEDTTDLKNKIEENKKYIIINEKLLRLYYRPKNNKNKNAHKIEYRIYPKIISIKTENDETLIFKNNCNNIIKKDITSTQLTIKDNTNENHKIKKNANQICSDIINYFNLENDISEKLTNKKTNKEEYEEYKGFLVYKDWIDIWKVYTHYELIKEEYLSDNRFDKNNIINRIIQEEKKIFVYTDDYKEINDIKNYVIDSENIINLDNISNISFAIINEKFLQTFYNTNNIANNLKPISFYLSFKKVEIKSNNPKWNLSFKINNIVILTNKDNKDINKNQKSSRNDSKIFKYEITNNSENIKKFIKFIYFKKEFLSENTIFKNVLNKAYIIKKNIFMKINKRFKLNEISKMIKNNKELKDIKYSDYDKHFEYIYNFLNEKQNDYINHIKQFFEEKEIINCNNEECNLNLKYSNEDSNLKYIDEFEIIDADFFTLLKTIIKQEFGMKLIDFSILEKNKIIFIIDSDKGKIFEIANFNSDEDINLEYLIEFEKLKNEKIDSFNEAFLNYLSKSEIEKLIDNEKSIIIKNKTINFKTHRIISNTTIKIKKKTMKKPDYNNNDNISKSDNAKPIEITDKNINKQNDQKYEKQYYLINEKLYELIEKNDLFTTINDKNIDYNKKNKHIQNIESILNTKIKKYEIVFKRTKNNKNEIINFPTNFNIIKQSQFNSIQNIFKDNKSKNIIEEIDFISVLEYCILIPKSNNFQNHNKKYIYLYLIQKKDEKKYYEPISIIEFKTNEEIEKALELIKKNSTKEKITKISKILQDELKCILYLISDDNNKYKTLFDSSIYNEKNVEYLKIEQKDKKEENNEKNLDNYLKMSIKLIKEKRSLINFISQSYKDNKAENEKENYLLKKYYFNEFKNIFYLKYINEIIKKNNNKNDKEIIGIIKSNLSEEQKKEISELNKDKIQKKLDDKGISKFEKNYANQDKSKGLIYYNNCDIITKEILDLIKQFDNNIEKKSLKVNCVFDTNKIIILIDNNLINIANYDKTEIFVEYIIKSNKSKLLFDNILQHGYKFILKYLTYNKIDIPILVKNNTDNISTEIYKIDNQGKIGFRISEKLKLFMLLAISQNNLKDSKLHEVYLINPFWLNQFKYNKIKLLIDDKYKKFPPINELNSIIIEKIISYLDKKDLLDIDNNLSSNIIDSSIPFDCFIEEFKLPNKKLLLFKNFVLIEKHMINLLEKHFSIKSIKYNISYIHKKEGDLIILKEYPLNINQNCNEVENLIIFGNYVNKENKYDIKYIFEYKNKKNLESELTYIIENYINKYIEEAVAFDKNNKYDYIVPITLKYEKVGIFYKYIEGFDYNKCEDYSKYLNNNQLINIMYLYANELYLQSKNENPAHEIKDRDFYLVKRKYITNLKKEIKYNDLKHIFDGKIKTIPLNDNDRKDIIKNISKDNLKLFSKTEIKNKKNVKDPTSFEIDIVPIVNPNNQSEMYMICKDFKLIEKNCAQILLNDIDNFPYSTLTCTFLGNNKIIFHYPKHKFDNKYYMYVISSIDEKYNYNNEYLLKYNDKESYEYHLEKLKKHDLNNYLQTFSFFNNIAPIVRSDYIEIGIIIKISDSISESSPSPRPPIPIPPPNPSSLSTRKNFPAKPLIGLQNIGATCYMNATLQCLCIIEKFVDYFKYNQNLYQTVINDINNEKLCSSFKLLIENLYPEEDKQRNVPYSPNEFKSKISVMNPLFQGIAANDAKDLVNFLIMTLHSELNTVKQNNIGNNNDDLFTDQRNKELMFKNFIQDFTMNNKSLISDLFYALNYNMTQCSNCNVVSYNYQIYFFLIFPLEEVRKFKLMNNNGFNPNNNEVDIYDCFNYDKKSNFMTGDNSMYCNYCKQTCNSTMCTYLATGPEILIIILNRGKGIEFNVKINFYLDLDLSNYIEIQNTGTQYELFGVITHIGESGMGGHFIAYCKEYWNNQWLKFNDAMVDPVKDFKSEVIDFAMPYLLFYKKKNI